MLIKVPVKLKGSIQSPRHLLRYQVQVGDLSASDLLSVNCRMASAWVEQQDSEMHNDTKSAFFSMDIARFVVYFVLSTMFLFLRSQRFNFFSTLISIKCSLSKSFLNLIMFSLSLFTLNTLF